MVVAGVATAIPFIQLLFHKLKKKIIHSTVSRVSIVVLYDPHHTRPFDTTTHHTKK